MANYAQERYQPALDYFTKAIQRHPTCGASVRVAVTCCCFKLEQYDRARAAVDRAVKMEVTMNVNVHMPPITPLAVSPKTQRHWS